MALCAVRVVGMWAQHGPYHEDRNHFSALRRSFSAAIDTSQTEQMLVEDCTVCCRPITLAIRCRPGAIVELVVADV
jgi:hypothetical protein